MNWRERRSIRRLERRAAGIRTPMEFPVPQPTTPLSSNVVPFTFDDYQRAKHGVGHPVVLELFRTFGAYRIKPKRGSVGLVWRNRAFWWGRKGYYRPGKSSGPRRPLQHLIWEQFHGRKMPRGHEIFSATGIVTISAGQIWTAFQKLNCTGALWTLASRTRCRLLNAVKSP